MHAGSNLKAVMLFEYTNVLTQLTPVKSIDIEN